VLSIFQVLLRVPLNQSVQHGLLFDRPPRSWGCEGLLLVKLSLKTMLPVMLSLALLLLLIGEGMGQTWLGPIIDSGGQPSRHRVPFGDRVGGNHNHSHKEK
jgi:hypothetical protein